MVIAASSIPICLCFCQHVMLLCPLKYEYDPFMLSEFVLYET